MRVIATAGHVDHGKSTLIQALTGTHPDRLKEEQEREMTIDLGFAWWTLPDGEEVGVVDVPGHQDFLPNMLAGMGGIDVALFVVSAEESIMPQTREHLDILNLLGIPAAVIALTQIDRLSAPARLETTRREVAALLAGTSLEGSAIVPVSAHTRAGLDELQSALAAVLSAIPPARNLDEPRLPIDRAFAMAGFGAVVTGTLIEGSLSAGEAVEILPEGLRATVRGLQRHKEKVTTAAPGGRTAVNLNGVDASQLARGMTVARPGAYQPTRRLDAQVHLLSGASAGIRHDGELKLHIGTSEVLARTRVLGVSELMPGEKGFLQLELSHPVVARRGDRFILRRPSPPETVGGGEVLDPHPSGRHKRQDPAVLARLKTIAGADPADLLALALEEAAVAGLPSLARRAGLTLAQAETALPPLLDAGRARVAGAQIVDNARLLAAHTRLLSMLDAFHKDEPLKGGISPAELRTRLNLAEPLFNLAVDEARRAGQVEDSGSGLLRLRGKSVMFSSDQQEKIDALLARFSAAPFSPPSLKECEAALGRTLLNALLKEGMLVRVSPELAFRGEDVTRAESDLRERIIAHGPVTLAQMRDVWNTSRRPVQALLEYFDAKGVTVREGEARRLK